jgi:hypothetical protein
MNKRPLPVTLIAWIYIVTGTFGIAFHLKEFSGQPPGSHYEIVWITLVRLLAVLAGIYLLRARNWARWLAIVWMAFHAAVSVFHSLPELAMHTALLAVFGYFLWRREANAYFGRPTSH